MNTKTKNDQIIIDSVRSLWRKRDIQAALVRVEQIDDDIIRKIWEATILIAKAELSGSLDSIAIGTHWFDDIDEIALALDVQVDIQLVKGRIASVSGDFAQAENEFFGALLKSREIDYLLGKVQAMVGLGQVKLMNNHFEQAFDLSITAASLAEKLPENNREYVETEVLLLQCHIHLNEQDYSKLKPKAEELYTRSQACGETLKFVHAQNHIAVVHAAKGDFKLAMPYFLDALDTCKKIEYQSLAIKIATNIATIHGQIHNYNEALARYHSISEEYEAPIRSEKKAVMFNNIGNLYIRLGKWKEAISYFLDAEKIADEKEYLPLKRLAFCQIARCLIESESYDAFLTHMKSEEDIFEGRVSNGLQILHYVKAKYALSQKKYEDAVRWGVQAIDVAQEFHDDTTILHTQGVLAQAYEENGHLSAALEVYKEYTQKKEELERERVKNMIVNTEIDYILAAKEKEIDTLQRENQLQSKLISSTSLVRKKNKELVAKNEELSYFARMIAVDFNKHLRVINQFVRILEQDASKDSQTKEYWDYIKKAVTKVSGLVDGLHKYSIVIDDSLLQNAVKISDIIKVVEHDLAPLIEGKEATIIYGELPTLNCGKAQLIRVFKELISNAIRFSAKGVAVKITSREEEDGHIIKVSDNGVGIPEGDERKVFWAFYRSGRLREEEGNGLGLAACKRIVEQYNGFISATIPESGGLAINIFWPNKCKQIDA